MARGADKVQRKAWALLTDDQKKVCAKKIAATKVQKLKRRLHSNNEAMARFIGSISGGGASGATDDNQAEDNESSVDEALDSTETSNVLEDGAINEEDMDGATTFQNIATERDVPGIVNFLTRHFHYN